MPSAQIPIWFTLVASLGAAVLGAMGVVTGNLISARREDRRVKLRSYLELERDHLRYVHEKTLWWIERRASVYEQILTLMSECQTDIEQVRADNESGIKLDSPEYMKIESQIDNLIRPFIQRTTLIAPPEVQNQIVATLEQLVTLLSCILNVLIAKSLFDYEDERLKLNEASDKMLELMQADLGITHPR